jgi:hypothetical protein
MMSKLGESYLRLNSGALRALEKRLSPRAREAARQMFIPQDEISEFAEKPPRQPAKRATSGKSPSKRRA